MTQYPSEDNAKLKRQRTELAISLAMRNHWEEAALANRSILELFPDEVEAYNRLGKALTELGRYEEASAAYRQALTLDANNTIAQRNLTRLSQAPAMEGVPAEKGGGVDPHLFIEETGKTGFTELGQPAEREVLARMSAGDRVNLRISGLELVVENARGEYLGRIQPRLALRLSNLMKGGNQYASAVTSLGHGSIRIVIKETYQHPSQEGKVSFLTKSTTDTFRPYIKESLLKYGLEGDEEDDFGEREGGDAGQEAEYENKATPEDEEERDQGF